MRWIRYGRERTTGGWLYHPKLIILFVFFLFTACTTAKIVVLHDSLTPEEHINLGVINERKGDYNEALRHYKIASRKLVVAFFYIGNVCFRMKDYRCAEKNYKRVIKEMPGNADAMNNLAWLYYTMGKNLDIAGKLVEEAIEINPAKRDTYMDTLIKIQALQGKNRTGATSEQ